MATRNIYKNRLKTDFESTPVTVLVPRILEDGTLSSIMEKVPLTRSCTIDQTILVTDLSIEKVLETGSIANLREVPPMHFGSLEQEQQQVLNATQTINDLKQHVEDEQ